MISSSDLTCLCISSLCFAPLCTIFFPLSLLGAVETGRQSLPRVIQEVVPGALSIHVNCTTQACGGGEGLFTGSSRSTLLSLLPNSARHSPNNEPETAQSQSVSCFRCVEPQNIRSSLTTRIRHDEDVLLSSIQNRACGLFRETNRFFPRQGDVSSPGRWLADFG